VCIDERLKEIRKLGEKQILLLLLLSFFLSCCIFHSTIFLCYLFTSCLFSLFTLTFIYNDTKNSSPLLFLTFHNLPFHSCIYALIYFVIFIFELIGGGVFKTEIGPHPFHYSIILIKKIISFSSN